MCCIITQQERTHRACPHAAPWLAPLMHALASATLGSAPKYIVVGRRVHTDRDRERVGGGKGLPWSSSSLPSNGNEMGEAGGSWGTAALASSDADSGAQTAGGGQIAETRRRILCER